MAAAEVLGLLAELEHSLRTNPKEKITSEEDSVLRNLKGSLVDTFLLGGFVSSLATWTMARRFNLAPRLLYSAGAAFLGGSWASKWVLSSCLEPIIVSDGSRMQRELANIMLAKHQEEDPRRSFVSKYHHRLFYPEQVFADSHPDNSFIRWRPRNSYEDNFNLTPVVKARVPVQEPPTSQFQRNSIRKPRIRHEETSEDPLECILGYPEAAVIHDSCSGNGIARGRKTARANRRAQKRERARNRHVAKNV